MTLNRRLLNFVFLPVIACAGGGAILCENALTVPDVFDRRESTQTSDSLAMQEGVRWQPAEISASGGVSLQASYFQPEQPNGAAVIAYHGLGRTRRAVFAQTRVLLRHGYAVLAVDSRGHGNSEGTQITYGLLETGDVKQWIDWLQKIHPADRIYGLGESMGAAILLSSVANEPRLNGVVAEGGFANFRAVAYHRTARMLELPASLNWLIGPIVEPAIIYGRLRYGLNLNNASPEIAVRNAKVPILLIHGTADKSIPHLQSRHLHEINREHTELWEPQDVGHVQALGRNPEEWERRVIGWLDAHR